MQQYPFLTKTKNLIRFCRHYGQQVLDDSFPADYAFSDRKSRFSVLKNPKTRPGPDECFSHFDIDARPFFDKLLGLDIELPGVAADRLQQCQWYSSINYYRSHIEEFFFLNGLRPLPPLEGICHIFYAATDRLCMRYTLRNTSATELPLRIRLFSVPAQGQEFCGDTFAQGFTFQLEQHVRETYRALSSLTVNEIPCHFAFTDYQFTSDWVEISIDPHGCKEFTCTADFALDVPWDCLSRQSIAIDASEAFTGAMQESEAAYQRLPAISERFRAFEPLVFKAVGTLRSLRYLDVDCQGKPTPWCHKRIGSAEHGRISATGW